ncbi:MAG: (2Fe-2S) ferredoxin domain-containing protein [Methanoregulaceae archaeon]|jgi:hypothetical protein
MPEPEKQIFVFMSSWPNGTRKWPCHTRTGSNGLRKFQGESAKSGVSGESHSSPIPGALAPARKDRPLVYPDNVWYAAVTAEDVPAILARHIEAGMVVKRLAR